MPEATRPLRWPLLTALAFVACASAWVLTHPHPVMLNGDAEMLQHPLLVDAVRQVREGRLPVWTTGRWGGSPLMGDPVVGAMYAPYYVSYLLTPFPHRRALDVSACLHLAVLATGVVLFLRGVGASAAAAVAASVMVAVVPTYVYAVRGWQQYWAALSYWPWLFWAASALVRRPMVTPALVAAVGLAAQVYAGYPEFSLYSGLPALTWVVLAPGGMRRIPLVLVVGVAAVGLAMPQVVTGLDMARDSIRLGPEAAAIMEVIDRVFSMTAGRWAAVVRATPLDAMAPAKLAPTVVLLAVLGAARAGFASRFLAAVAVLSAALATGGNPIYETVRVVPPFSFFGAPLKLFYLTAFATVMLAGFGLASLGDLPPRRQRVAVVVLAAAGALSSGGGGWMVGLLAAGALVAAAAPPVVVPTVAAGVAALGSVGFLLATGALETVHPFVPPGYVELLRVPPPITPARGARLLALHPEPPPSQLGLNFGALWGFESWNGMADLTQRREVGVIEARTPGDAAALVRALAADPVVVAAGSPMAKDLVASGFAVVGRLDGLVFLAPPTSPPPRVVLVPTAEAATFDEALAAARAGRALDDRRVLVETEVLPGGAAGDPAGRIEATAWGRGTVTARVAVSRPTWLVAREPYYRNWRATVDGRPADVHPAGGFFLGVLVDAGTHDVRLAYHERGLLPGLVIAILAAVCLPSAVRRSTPHVRSA